MKTLISLSIVLAAFAAQAVPEAGVVVNQGEKKVRVRVTHVIAEEAEIKVSTPDNSGKPFLIKNPTDFTLNELQALQQSAAEDVPVTLVVDRQNNILQIVENP